MLTLLLLCRDLRSHFEEGDVCKESGEQESSSSCL